MNVFVQNPLYPEYQFMDVCRRIPLKPELLIAESR